ncbi:NYN domain-containing protein [Microcoleus sp. FACHB-68]|uniref:NYN domain-containing protein n=1 Tax=Microcoleus sp. FACHB-68 TaxID=2692826 RepID=UPI0011CB485B|nr:NYN domain-containing protein [Microcoleus sp. FACHB-68]MBD1937516.1 NYN domain-containing protein [Microcoleus sp. FACHB-68]
MAPPSLPTVLLVDGYNIIGIWPDLTKTRDHDGMESARRELIEALVNYSAFQGFETRLVFDAQYQDTGSTREEITRHVSVHYTGFGQTADTYIEKICANCRHEFTKLKQRVIVATSDRAQQLTVVGYGAEWMSAQQLAYDIEAIGNQVRRKQQSSKPSARRLLASSLDPIAQQRLAQLRMGRRP